MTPKSIIKVWNKRVAYYFVTLIQKFVSLYDGQQGGYKLDDIKNYEIELPVKNEKIDFDFMESFVAELETQRVAELEVQRVAELKAYLTVTRLKDYKLTEDEKNALNMFDNIEWQEFNVKKLFGKSNRGKRLKSFDRISGTLPFVTAGEVNEGISDFIGNEVEIFNANTITIDMFGSAKYRNYKYGADDHIAVVPTENLEKYATIFVTSAIHKSSHNGQFNYGKNFYAKDADELYIKLPVIEDKPDYSYMSILISAIQKLVIKNVVEYTNLRIQTTKEVIKN